MKNIMTASNLLKIAVINYFSGNIEFKVRRTTVIMIPVIVIGSFIAWYVNNR